jgi:hypothetical protein
VAGRIPASRRQFGVGRGVGADVKFTYGRLVTGERSGTALTRGFGGAGARQPREVRLWRVGWRCSAMCDLESFNRVVRCRKRAQDDTKWL